MDDIRKNHAIKKIITLNLATNDSSGKVVFKKGNSILSSPCVLKSGETIKLEFELTDGDYEIEENTGVSKNLFNNKKASAEIKITDEMDGTTIRREDFISLRRKG